MAAPPPRVFDVLVTDTGRASFWAESAVRSGDQIDWRFPGGQTFRGQILAENRRGRLADWVSVLLALKAKVDHGVDVRNHHAARTWDKGYCDS
jgi:hypothetical protein